MATFISPRYASLVEAATPGTNHVNSDHSLLTAPVFTGDASTLAGPDAFLQHAFYGHVIEQRANGFPDHPGSSELFINTNAPFSAVVCGVQGSGKSHSTSVLLESCLIQDHLLGTLPAPLSGLLFHFDTAAGGGTVQPCEAAYMASIDPLRGAGAVAPEVTVLVLPNSLDSMRRVYANLPGIEVQPLHFAADDISAERLLSMMKVDSESQMPLYMEFIVTYLRKLKSFDYNDFRAALKEQKFSAQQKSMLNIRLSLLDACLEGGTRANRVSNYFGRGRLTIIDLSSPFMDSSSACKIVVLDEAHKYLSDNGSASRLTDSLLSIIRQQRHLGTRVIVSTQEPTVVPSKFLDLCSFVIAHRFSSPQWLAHLLHHVAAKAADTESWFSKIVSLGTGEGMLFAPSGLSVRHAPLGDGGVPSSRLAPLGPGYLHVKSRLRITRDGGRSLLAVPHLERGTAPAVPDPRGESASETTRSRSSTLASDTDDTDDPDDPDDSDDSEPDGSEAAPTLSELVEYLEQRRRQGARDCPLRTLPASWARGKALNQRIAEARALFLVREYGEGDATYLQGGQYAPLFVVLLEKWKKGVMIVSRDAVAEALKRVDAKEAQGLKPPAYIIRQAEKLGLLSRRAEGIVLEKF